MGFSVVLFCLIFIIIFVLLVWILVGNDCVISVYNLIIVEFVKKFVVVEIIESCNKVCGLRLNIDIIIKVYNMIVISKGCSFKWLVMILNMSEFIVLFIFVYIKIVLVLVGLYFMFIMILGIYLRM